MKKTYSTVLNIQKPQKPHRQVKMEEKPSELEIRKRYERIEKLKKLGIETTTLDMKRLEEEEFEEDVEKLKASILIMKDKEVPKELEEKILARNKEKDKNKKSEN